MKYFCNDEKIDYVKYTQKCLRIIERFYDFRLKNYNNFAKNISQKIYVIDFDKIAKCQIQLNDDTKIAIILKFLIDNRMSIQFRINVKFNINFLFNLCQY